MDWVEMMRLRRRWRRRWKWRRGEEGVGRRGAAVLNPKYQQCSPSKAMKHAQTPSPPWPIPKHLNVTGPPTPSPIPKPTTGERKRLTTSNPLPPNTLSVVAATLPPLRLKSHAICLRPSCGNICATCSTEFALTVPPRAPAPKVPG